MIRLLQLKQMSLRKEDAGNCIEVFEDMFSKDVFPAYGDCWGFIQTKSLLSFCQINGLQECPQEMVSTYPGSSSQANGHLYQSLSSNTSKTLSFPNLTYEQEKVSKIPSLIKDDACQLSLKSNIQHQTYQKLSPHGILMPQEEETQSFGTGPVISKFISTNGNSNGFTNSENNQDSNTIPSENLLISTPQDESNQSNPRQIQGRKDDSNNADKKIITILFATLSTSQKRKWKAEMDSIKSDHNIEIKIVKSSRYGFIQTLISLKHIFGFQFVQGLLQKFQAKLIQFVQDIRKKPESQTNNYLMELPICYIKSFQLFLSGSSKDSMEALYQRMANFKQNKYMLQGIQKVEKLEEDLLSLKK